MIINQHPEWKMLESWFTDRAKALGVSVYSHTESVSVESAIRPDIADAATELAYRAGRSLFKT